MTLARRLLGAAGAGGTFMPPAGLLPSSTVAVTRSGSNPTFNFNSLPETIVKVGSTYWCVYQPGQGGSIALASSSSPDGTWTAQGTIITGTAIYAPHIYAEGGTFYVFYASDKGVGGDGKIYVATASTVNGTYTKYPTNVSPTAMLSPGTTGDWDDYRLGEPSIVKSGSTYYMTFMGEKTAYQTTERIGIATASSLTGPWTKGGANPIITPGTGWEAYMVADPELFYVNGYYWCYYLGVPGPSSSNTPWDSGLAYATDPENGPWTKFAGNPMITASGSGFDENGAFRGSIYIESGVYHLVYTGLPAGAPDLNTMKGGNATLMIT